MICMENISLFYEENPFLTLNLMVYILISLRGTFKSKAPLRVQFSPALGGGVGKG